jgi:hypothetical protein
MEKLALIRVKIAFTKARRNATVINRRLSLSQFSSINNAPWMLWAKGLRWIRNFPSIFHILLNLLITISITAASVVPNPADSL